jgi:hypothetical protein
MKRLTLAILVCVIFIGCEGFQNPRNAAIEINGVGFTAEDFNSAFENSPFFIREGEAKEEFLDRFISRKLMLNEAEKRGLDKDPEFLQDVQYFWEQSLLKRIYEFKNKETAVEVTVTDKEINDYYYSHQDQFSGKELGQVYGQIKAFLHQYKQNESLAEWVQDLNNKADIRIDYKKLGLENTGK